MKLCVKCKWYEYDPPECYTFSGEDPYQPKCSNPEAANPINGTMIFCKYVRNNPLTCGIEGKLWEETDAEVAYLWGAWVRVKQPIVEETA